jgi:hypothetical protein
LALARAGPGYRFPRAAHAHIKKQPGWSCSVVFRHFINKERLGYDESAI